MGLFLLLSLQNNNVVNVNGVVSGGIVERKREEVQFLKGTEMFLETVPAHVLMVTVDGAKVAFSTTPGTNKLEFNSEVRGKVFASYVGKTWEGYATVRDRLYEFDMEDLSGEIHYFQGEVSGNKSTDRDVIELGNGEEVLVFMPDEMNYVKGFKLNLSGDSVVTPLFTASGERFIPTTLNTIPIVLTTAENVYVQTDGVDFFAVTTADIKSVVGVRFKGVDVPYTKIGDTVLKLDKEYDKVVVTYSTKGNEIAIKNANIHGKRGADVFG